MDFKYYRSVFGRACARFGTDVYIGCVRTPNGFEWNDRPVAIPLAEVQRNVRSYQNAVRRGDLEAVDGPSISEKSTQPESTPVDSAADDDSEQGGSESVQVSAVRRARTKSPRE